MCTENQLEIVLSAVSAQAKNLFEDSLCSIMLYGSYARGDYDSESDVDIMILADISSDDINRFTRFLREKIFHLEIEYNCVLSLCVVPKVTFERFKNILPFYKNVLKEGVKIAV